MYEFSITDNCFSHQQCVQPFLNSKQVLWKRDGERRKINVYTDNHIKSHVVDIPQDGNYNICLLLEPYTFSPWTDIYDYIQTDFEKFDLIISHNKFRLGHMMESRPDKFVYSTNCICASWLDESFIGRHPKSKMFSMAFSYKMACEGHEIRHRIYEKYKDSGLIDFFGSGVPNYQGEFRDAFKDYKYTIVCENSLQRGFNSEKLRDAFLTGCIPIYWGSRILDQNYKQEAVFYFSPDNDWNVNRDFTESFENLENILKFLTENDPYDSLYPFVERNFDYTYANVDAEGNLLKILQSRGFIE